MRYNHGLPFFSCDGCEQDRIYNFSNFPFHFLLKNHCAHAGSSTVIQAHFGHAVQPSWFHQSSFSYQRSSKLPSWAILAPAKHLLESAKLKQVHQAFWELGHA